MNVLLANSKRVVVAAAAIKMATCLVVLHCLWLTTVSQSVYLSSVCAMHASTTNHQAMVSFFLVNDICTTGSSPTWAQLKSDTRKGEKELDPWRWRRAVSTVSTGINSTNTLLSLSLSLSLSPSVYLSFLTVLMANAFAFLAAYANKHIKNSGR